MDATGRIGMLNAIVAEHVNRRNYWLCVKGQRVASAFDPARLEELARGLFSDSHRSTRPEVEVYSDGSMAFFKPNTSKPFITID